MKSLGASLSMNNYEEFERKWQQWKDWLSGEDTHSIGVQISELVWNSAVFNFVNTCIQIAPRNLDGEPELNGMVWDLFVRMYFRSQMLSLRRLNEGLINPGSRRRDDSVISIRAILEDMKANVNLITRRNISQFEGRECRRKVISSATIDRLLMKLDPVNKIKRHSDKFIAHAATPASKQELKPDEINITFMQLKEAEKSLCQVYVFLSDFLQQSNLELFPVPEYDQFYCIDRPLVDSVNLEKMYSIWHDYEDEENGWSAFDIKEYIST